MQRRLAAILAADMVGYSRLIEHDETGTIERLQSDRKALIDPKIAAHDGTIVRMAGDGALVEFPSVVEAAQCAIDIQRGMQERNATRNEAEQIQFRMGVNTGDIVVEDDNLHGEGINVAARLESLCEPSGILLTEEAAHYVDGKIDAGLEFVEERTVKNIERPVRIWRVRLDRATSPSPVAKRRPGRPVKPRILLLSAVALIALAAALIWYRPWVPREEPASVHRMVYSLPEKPSIAVLPFVNLTGQPDDEYLGDGIAEALITALSRIPDLFVVARSSTFAYKGKSPTIREVAESLGVQYVLEGSVQRAGDRLRITAQLIDALSGHHIWAEDYDRQSGDLLALQDDIIWQISTELEVELAEGEQARAWRESTDNPEAYGLFLKGRTLLYSGELERARELMERAVELDPEFLAGWVKLGWVYHELAWSSDTPEAYQEKAIDCVERVIALDDSFSDAYALRGSIYRDYEGDFAQSVSSMRKAVTLNPNSAVNAILLANELVKAGEIEEAMALVQRAKRLDPIPPDWSLSTYGKIYLFSGQCEEAIAAYQYCVGRQPENWTCQVEMAVAYLAAGREEEGRKQGREALKITRKDFSLAAWAGAYWDPAMELSAARDPYAGQCVVDRVRRIMFMHKAGLPD